MPDLFDDCSRKVKKEKQEDKSDTGFKDIGSLTNNIINTIREKREKSFEFMVENYYTSLLKNDAWKDVEKNWNKEKDDILFIARKADECNDLSIDNTGKPLISFGKLTHILSGSLIRTMNKDENELKKDLCESFEKDLLEENRDIDNYLITDFNTQKIMKNFVEEIQKKLK